MSIQFLSEPYYNSGNLDILLWLIISAHWLEARAQCYHTKDLGSTPESNIQEINMDYEKILISVIKVIKSEHRNFLPSPVNQFMFFKNVEQCLTYEASVDMKELEIMLTDGITNQTILTNVIIFPYMENCLIQEDNYPSLLAKVDCQAWLTIMTEELQLQNSVSSFSSEFLHLGVTGSNLVGIDALKNKDSMVGIVTDKVKIQLEFQNLLKTKLMSLFSSTINLGQLLKIPIFTNLHVHMTQCIGTNWVKSFHFKTDHINCLYTFPIERAKRSTLFSRIFGNGQELDDLHQRVNLNAKTENDNLMSLSQNQHLLASQTKINQVELSETNHNIQLIQRQIVAHFVKIQIAETSSNLELSRNSNFLRFYDKVEAVTRAIDKYMEILGSILMDLNSTDCKMLDNFLCFNGQESHVQLQGNTLLLSLSVSKPVPKNFTFISCVPVDQKQTSFLDYKHGLFISNDTVLLENKFFLDISDLTNRTLVYSKLKPITHKYQENIVILKDGFLTGFVCLNEMLIFNKEKVFNCTLDPIWVRVMPGDKFYSAKGEIITKIEKSLTIESRISFKNSLNDLLSYSKDELTNVFNEKRENWHNYILNSLNKLPVETATGMTIGVGSLLFLSCTACIFCFCLYKQLCCWQRQARVQIVCKESQPAEPETHRQRVRRILEKTLREGQSNEASQDVQLSSLPKPL